MPVELEGDFAAATAIEGQHLDDAVARAEQLLQEMFPDQTAELVQEWERICALIPSDGDTLQKRRDRVVAKLRETGGLSRQYFIDLAAVMGYTISIDEPYATEGNHVWRITFTGQPLYEFYCGESCCDELLLDWPDQTAAEGLFQELKPAWSRLIIAYS
jgi:uncharacterized protein YmfQ (DUF2313 family)